jgi:hypothetical protein
MAIRITSEPAPPVSTHKLDKLWFEAEMEARPKC